MIDTDGDMATSCDCRRAASTICLHQLVIERYYAEFEEPVLTGEEPSAFLIYTDHADLKYLFSVATASGSARHHSHKRTIVTSKFSGAWTCKSCPRIQYLLSCVNSLIIRDCRHIKAAQQNLEVLGFENGDTIKEAAEAFTKSRSKPIIRRCISHLPIQPPAWCRLPSDTITSNDSFHLLQNLPAIFGLNASARCSCGYESIGNHNQITKQSEIIIYTSTTALKHFVETIYCDACTNTHGRIGPDLGNYGILNWNNRIGFSHQLLNTYTSQFTRSETPFHAFYQSIQDEYLNAHSPVDFCDEEVFEYAWFAFIQLQEIQSSMECSICGPNPKVIIADGISVSFPSHHRTEGLRPPTASDREHAWVKLRKCSTKSTSFSGPKKSRKLIYEALDLPDRTARVEKLQLEIEDLRKLSVTLHLILVLTVVGRKR